VPQNLNEEKIMTKKKIWLGMLALALTFGMMIVGCGGEVEPDPWKPPTTDVTTLTADTWADGSIATSSGKQWFSFTAAAETQYIHFDPDTLTIVYVGLYDSNGSNVKDGESNSSTLSANTLSTSRTLTIGNEYYIVVTPYGSGSGTYKIAFGESTPPPSIDRTTISATTLTADTWANGNIATSSGEQWFTFTATGATQYIHFEPGDADFGIYRVYVQLYDSAGSTVENRKSSSSSSPPSWTVTSGDEYYIKVTPYSGNGAYGIAFSASSTPPPVTLPTTGVTTLTANTFASGNIATNGGEEWFTFTATATPQYIHFEEGTLQAVSVQLYDSNGSKVENPVPVRLSANSPSASRTVTNGSVYYIKATPVGVTGTYRIGFNTSSTTPPPSVTLPTTNVTTLTADIWASGNIATTNGEQWFKFTATATTQYIHFEKDTLTNVYVQLYDNNGSRVGIRSGLGPLGPYTSRELTSGYVYYIKVTPSSSYGTYRIAFNESSGPPSITLPTTGVTTLNANTWTNGNISTANGDQWFKFTATAATQYIHFEKGTMDTVFVQLYDSNGKGVEGGTYNLPISQTLTVGSEYHIKVTPTGNGGTYRIAFNASSTQP
jgi:hypothetical protein